MYTYYNTCPGKVETGKSGRSSKLKKSSSRRLQIDDIDDDNDIQ